MTFIETIPPEKATGRLAEVYESHRAQQGHVPNFARAFSLQPDVYLAWQQLNGAIKAGMDLRRYELATVAAARRLRSSYCMLAHGSALVDRFLPAETVAAAAADHHDAGLDELDVSVMDLADKVAADASSVTDADLERLRELGLEDSEILGVVLAAAARCFFSKTLDAVGVQPDATYASLDPALRDALVVGRPIAAA
ncbi:MAG TPA: hypothetical protein VGI54_08720 [Solirubrobacteraceae bacterium]